MQIETTYLRHSSLFVDTFSCMNDAFLLFFFRVGTQSVAVSVVAFEIV